MLFRTISPGVWLNIRGGQTAAGEEPERTRVDPARAGVPVRTPESLVQVRGPALLWTQVFGFWGKGGGGPITPVQLVGMFIL